MRLPRAASLSLLLLLVATCGRSASEGGEAFAITRAVATEVARSHHLAAPPEASGEDLAAPSARLPALRAPLVASVQLSSRGFSTLGASQHVLMGHPAARLDVADVDGLRHTLLQAPAAGELARVIPGAYEGEGVTVHIWREGDTFFALAEP